MSWEWQDNSGWKAYDAATSQQIDDAYNAGLDTVNLTHGYFSSRNYTADFTVMAQINNATGFQRAIREPGSAGASGPCNQDDDAYVHIELKGEPEGCEELDQSIFHPTNLDDVKGELCSICFDGFTEDEPGIKLSKCKACYFHKDCVEYWLKEHMTCPVCKSSYGIFIGNQPNGTMDITKSSADLPGFPAGSGSYTVNYSFPNGVQSEKHPHPGVAYSGTSRTAYFPGTPEGKKVIELLKLTFKRRHCFQVGKSLTTQKDNCVIWNGIHHKTTTSGGPTNFGYPDPTYLTRVTEEMAAKGVTEADLPSPESSDAKDA